MVALVCISVECTFSYIMVRCMSKAANSKFIMADLWVLNFTDISEAFILKIVYRY